MEPLEADLTSLHVRRAVGGSDESLGWLVDHLDPLLRAQVRLRLGPRARNEADVEDVVAEVWTVALTRVQDIRPRAGRFAPVFVAFLGTTASNVCNALLRRAIRARTGAGGASTDDLGDTPDAEIERLAARTRGVLTRVEQRDVREAVEEALGRLGEAKREVLVLRLLEQRTNAEIAERQGVPANTIAVRYRRALEELRERLPAGVWSDFRDLAGEEGEEHA